MLPTQFHLDEKSALRTCGPRNLETTDSETAVPDSRRGTSAQRAGALTLVNDALTVPMFPYLPRLQHEALDKTNLIALSFDDAGPAHCLNLCRKHDCNRSDYSLAEKNRVRFMTPK